MVLRILLLMQTLDWKNWIGRKVTMVTILFCMVEMTETLRRFMFKEVSSAVDEPLSLEIERCGSPSIPVKTSSPAYI